ncbi:hypothetical protein NEDG_00518 [Nematocida displodere]|uniref:Uncharacterized protein n=1 Tax=Nematocida displodere TaxID=1805483 RepID=A0A177EJ89_9MICR|nr:hypothetical protein NEDG_00518 [Nematocida displodere]
MQKFKCYHPGVAVIGLTLLLAIIRPATCTQGTTSEPVLAQTHNLSKNRTLQKKPEPDQKAIFFGPYTNQTIEFFKNCNAELDVVWLGCRVCMVNIQPKHINIYLDDLWSNEIPEKIDPRSIFTAISIFGSAPKPHRPTRPPSLPTLARLLQTLSDVQVGMLFIESFPRQVEPLPTTTPPIHLHVTDMLSLRNVSPSFLEWFCGAVDLSKCEHGITVALAWCNTKSIACLDYLSIKALSGLSLIGLLSLKHLDCSLKKCTDANALLALYHLPKLSNVSMDQALAISETVWSALWIDVHIWNCVCCLVSGCISVKDQLVINVTQMEKLWEGVAGWKDPGLWGGCWW